MPRVSSWPLLALCGSRTTTRKSSVGGLRSLRLEDVDDLRRPQELVLEVDQVLGAAQRAGVGLEDRELAAGQDLVGALGDGADELDGRVALRRDRLGQLERLPVDRLPAHGEVGGDVARRSGRARARTRRASRSPPPCAGARWSRSGRRRARSGRCRRRTRARRRRSRASRGGSASCGRARRARTGSSCPSRAASRCCLTSAAARLEDRHRRTRPDEHAHRDALGGVGEQFLDRGRVARAGVEVGLEVPASRRARGAWRCGSPRPSAAARSRRRSGPRASCPRAAGRAVCAHRPSVAGASACSCPWRRRRRRWWWIIARSMPSPTRGVERSSGWDAMRYSVPASLTSPWPQISPPRSAWPPSASRCPCSRTIFDPAGMRERLERARDGDGRRRASGTTRSARRRSAPSTRARSGGWTRSRSCSPTPRTSTGSPSCAEEDPEHGRRARGRDRLGRGAADRAEEQRLFTGDYDAGDALVTVNAGAGGTDAQDWAEMVLRMEMRWAERRGFKVELLEASAGEEAGIKSATFRVVRRQRLRALLGREGRAPARAPVAVRLRQPPPDVLRGRRGRAGRRGGGRGRDRGRRPAGRHLPRLGRGRPARQQDRLGGAHHAPADAASSCSARTSARSPPTARPRWRCCAPS